jgi:hypothetical protein
MTSCARHLATRPAGAASPYRRTTAGASDLFELDALANLMRASSSRGLDGLKRCGRLVARHVMDQSLGVDPHSIGMLLGKQLHTRIGAAPDAFPSRGLPRKIANSMLDPIIALALSPSPAPVFVAVPCHTDLVSSNTFVFFVLMLPAYLAGAAQACPSIRKPSESD